MNQQIGILAGAALLLSLTGCVSHGDRPYAEGDSGAPQMVVVLQDDYVYYPGYQVYYSSQRHQYTYRDGRAWVTRATPPRVSVEELAAAPSVPMAFHDFPARHHATVTRDYPKNWAPAANRSPQGDHDEKHER